MQYRDEPQCGGLWFNSFEPKATDPLGREAWADLSRTTPQTRHSFFSCFLFHSSTHCIYHLFWQQLVFSRKSEKIVSRIFIIFLFTLQHLKRIKLIWLCLVRAIVRIMQIAIMKKEKWSKYPDHKSQLLTHLNFDNVEIKKKTEQILISKNRSFTRDATVNWILPVHACFKLYGYTYLFLFTNLQRLRSLLTPVCFPGQRNGT